MFTGIITDIGTVRTAEQRGDLRLTIACALRPRHGRPRRLDRLLGRVPDRGRQGRRLVRGRCQRRNRRRAPPPACGARARASTSNARCASATSSAATSSPAMSTASATVIGAAPTAARIAHRHRRPRRSWPLHRRQGLDHARRRVADRQRGHATPTTARPTSPSTSSPTPPQHTTLGSVAAGRAAQCRDRRPRPLSEAHDRRAHS